MPWEFSGLSCSGAITNDPAASGVLTRNVYSMRSFSIEGGGGALVVATGALDEGGAPFFGRLFPIAFPIEGPGTNWGVTETGAPDETPVPATVIVPGTSIWNTPVYLLEGK